MHKDAHTDRWPASKRRVEANEGIILYLENQSLCPFFRIGSPSPLSASECGPLSLEPKGGNTRFRVSGGGGGGNSEDWRESLALCLLCVTAYENAMSSKKLPKLSEWHCELISWRPLEGGEYKDENMHLWEVQNTTLPILLSHYLWPVYCIYR
jgi:hypothetical protein